MSNIANFSINADDIPRACHFYENVFGWKFEQMGPPDLYRIDTGESDDKRRMNTLHARRELKEGVRMAGYECTISVPSLTEVVTAIRAQNGKIIMEETVIVGIGRLIFFEDTEGNIAGAMQYDENAGRLSAVEDSARK
jgi:predicted enzyme related to lactoylglutathione lyase